MKSDNQPKVPVHVTKCPFCGGSNIVRSTMVDQTADAGRIGLSYHTRFLITGTEPLYADLCDDCGSLIRLFLKEVGKKWATK